MRPRTLLILTALGLGIRALAGLSAWASLLVDPLLVVAVLAALGGKPGPAMGAGLLTGTVEDAWIGGWYGQFAFIHLVIAFMLSKIAGWVDLASTPAVAVTLALSTAADWGLQSALAAAFDKPLADPPGAGSWFAAMLVNTVLGLALRRLVQRLEDER